jgi:hypothetical protein
MYLALFRALIILLFLYFIYHLCKYLLPPKEVHFASEKYKKIIETLIKAKEKDSSYEEKPLFSEEEKMLMEQELYKIVGNF